MLEIYIVLKKIKGFQISDAYVVNEVKIISFCSPHEAVKFYNP